VKARPVPPELPSPGGTAALGESSAGSRPSRRNSATDGRFGRYGKAALLAVCAMIAGVVVLLSVSRIHSEPAETAASTSPDTLSSAVPNATSTPGTVSNPDQSPPSKVMPSPASPSNFPSAGGRAPSAKSSAIPGVTMKPAASVPPPTSADVDAGASPPPGPPEKGKAHKGQNLCETGYCPN